MSQKLSKHYPKIPGYRLFNPRRFQIFAVGSAKTGTHSLAAMFADHFRSRHECEVNREIALIKRKLNGECQPGEVEKWFIERSHRLWLEADISHLHGFCAVEIARALPEARFILTLREPYSWLDSSFNQTLSKPLNQHWADLRSSINGALPETYPEQESMLQQHGLYPIASQLDRWAERIEKMTAEIPSERLLVIKTDQLKQDAARIADFCAVQTKYLSVEKSHQFRAVKKAGLLENIDRHYVDQLIELRCGEILKRYF